MPYASQALIGARGFSSQRKSCIFRKLHNNVAAGEKKVSERTSFFYMCTRYDSILKIDGRNLTYRRESQPPVYRSICIITTPLVSINCQPIDSENYSLQRCCSLS